MYLKTIEIHGFKSFAHKTRLDFVEGITGIVGPNGSGKSNIADAVRWVLGEQKVKQLRGSSMQDVIFAGTQTRKPQGYASVALTLDNSDHQLPIDYTEVTVARQVYRSGESEYSINGRVCRLRDVQELFYDTGIGKDGYSLIGQGQVERILSGKPEERRELFDEAAGIVKFKRRKAAAIRKLENEEQNILRINDILSELERRVTPLKRQSEAARIYLRKKETLKSCDINLFRMESKRLRAQEKELEDKIEIAQAQRVDAQKQYEQTSTAYEQTRQDLTKLDEELEKSQERIRTLAIEKQRMEGEIDVLREQIRTIETSGSHYENRLQTLEMDLDKKRIDDDAQKEEKQAVETTLTEVTARRQELEDRQAQIQELLRAEELGVSDGHEQSMELLEQHGRLQAEAQKLETLLEQLNIRKGELNAQLLEENPMDDEAVRTLREKENIYQGLKEELDALEQKRQTSMDKNKEWAAKLEEAQKNLEKLRDLYSRQNARCDSLRNIAERYEGYGNSIRRVMEQKDENTGIYGVVADLLQVDPRYETAIETALGASIRNIVTDNEKTAKRMIAFLKENRYGRATFLPLSEIKTPDHIPAAKAVGEPGAIGLADTLVETRPEYRAVASSLLGRTLVADHIDHAIAIARKYQYAFRIVTEDGEMLQPGGSISGGAFRQSDNLLGRKREIEESEKQIARIRQDVKKQQSRIEEVRMAMDLTAEEVSQLGEQRQELALRLNTARLEAEHVRSLRQQKEEAGASIRAQISDIDARIAQIHGAGTQSGRRDENLKERQDQIQARIEEHQKNIGIYSEQLQAVADELSSVVLEEAGAKQQLTYIEENRQRIHADIKQAEREMQSIRASMDGNGSDIDRKQQKIAELKENCAALEQTLKGQEDEREKASLCREETAGSSQALVQNREDFSQEIHRLEKELYRLTDQRDRVRGSLAAQTEYLWTEYDMSPSAAEQFADEELTNAADLKKNIDRLKKEIRELGPVNVNAIEEYKEVSERYAFMCAQRDDLEEAREKLTGIIAELDEGMRKQFTEKFSDIRTEFDRVFKELFGGGQGTLELTEGEDVLESGIRIIAQPPGKKLQNMMQLSGGEKALTAIALLFAIQNLKPSPFCLLDEIEAALDDPNVERFAHYLRKLTSHTQFIIITHRKGTMAATDQLYGITMQEKGVSTLVAVSLIEKDLDH